MPTSDDLQFKELILSNKLATPQQLEECWETLIAYEESGINKPLSSVILDKGYMTLKQVNAIRQLQGKNDQYMIRGYTILEILGQGGLGVVYKARQDSIGRIVAIKVMFPNFSNNQDYVKRFMREAKISAELEHENIVKGIDFGESEGLYFFVMEYVEGKSLKDLISERKSIEEKEAVRIILKMAEALKHAEHQNLIHRDIKPENILITKDGIPKLCDLGLAKTIDDNFSLTRTGIVMGTPYYISPEQAVAQKDLDIRSDIYSLGVTLYHMVTGEVPYQGDTVINIISQHLSSQIPSPKSKNPRLSDDICKLIYVMMAKKREERYQSTQELIVDLSRLLQGDPIVKNCNFNAGQTLKVTQHGKEISESSADKMMEILHKTTKEEFSEAEDSGELVEVKEKKASQIGIQNAQEKESQKLLHQIEERVNSKRNIRWRKISLFILFFLILSSFFAFLYKKPLIPFIKRILFSENKVQKIEKPPFNPGPKYEIGEDAAKEYKKFSEKIAQITSTYTIEKIQKNMVYIPQGTVALHHYKSPVRQDVEAFWLDQYEVSKAEYYEFCQKTNHAFPLEWIKNGWHQKGIPEEYKKEPVTHVSFYDASLYAKYVGKRLPTEVEWEYAIKYKEGDEYPWGSEFREGYANVNTGKIAAVHAFSKGKTSIGIFQMAGNVWEWTSTAFGDAQENRIIKGGSFAYPGEYARASYRDAFYPHLSKADLGFRCAFSDKN